MGNPHYAFRNISPYLRMGTASDRYAGWIGQVYSPKGEGYHDWLRSRGLGYVLSHSTWQKPLHVQWEQAGARPSAANGEIVVRLLTPLRMRYPEAYALTHPFDKPVLEISESVEGKKMVDDAAALIMDSIEHHKTINMILNNRAYGNAPDLARAIVDRVET